MVKLGMIKMRRGKMIKLNKIKPKLGEKISRAISMCAPINLSQKYGEALITSPGRGVLLLGGSYAEVYKFRIYSSRS